MWFKRKKAQAIQNANKSREADALVSKAVRISVKTSKVTREATKITEEYKDDITYKLWLATGGDGRTKK